MFDQDTLESMFFTNQRVINMAIQDSAFYMALKENVEIPKKDLIRILNVGCGVCTRAVTQAEYALKQADKVEFTGIDIDNCMILTAMRTPRDENENIKYSFLPIDGRRIDEYVADPFDLIFVDHPETRSELPMWTRIMETIPKVHAQGGLLVASHYWKDEADNMVKILGGYDVGEPIENQYAKPDPHMDMTPHNYLVIGRRL